MHGEKAMARNFTEALEKALKAQNITNLYACIGYPEVEDQYLTKNSVQYHEHLGYRFIGTFKNVATNLTDGTIWFGWKNDRRA